MREPSDYIYLLSPKPSMHAKLVVSVPVLLKLRGEIEQANPMSAPFEGFCCTGCGNARSSPARYRGACMRGINCGPVSVATHSQQQHNNKMIGTARLCRKFTKKFSRSCSALSASFSARLISRLACATPGHTHSTDKATGHT